MLDMIASMEDAGDNQLKITLTEASPSFLSVLAMFSSGIMPEAYCEEVGEEAFHQLLSEQVLMYYPSGTRVRRWSLRKMIIIGKRLPEGR